MSLFDYTPPEPPAPAAGNLPPYTVAELSQALKRTVESAFGLVRVRGEIVQPKLSNGNMYLCLKDETAVLDAVAWRGAVGRLQLKPEHGMDVICTGRLTTYPGRSKYQLVIESMELAGEGALLKLLEDRKRRLQEEGLFDAARKRPIPHIPESIGVITSPSGAVIHDILHRLADRFPRRVLVWPVAVQGPGAAEQIAAAIEGFNRLEENGKIARPSVLIVARGGGSLEDLMAFNEEIVIRAVAASHIPVISAVGHETDTTLIDYVSDLRAPTPTAAAEFAVPVRAELIGRLGQASGRLVQAIWQAREGRRTGLQMLARGLPDPRRLVESAAQTLDDRAERLGQAIAGYLKAKSLHLARDAAALKHPRNQLAEAGHRLAILDQRLLRATRDVLSRGYLRAGHVQIQSPRPMLAMKRQDVVHLAGRGRRARERLMADCRTRFDDLQARLDPEPLKRLVASWDYTLGNRVRHLESLSYHKILERGFAVVRNGDGRVIDRRTKLTGKQSISIEFADGKIDADVVKR
jgi:exodeoxyribonuclease VII large subunit